MNHITRKEVLAIKSDLLRRKSLAHKHRAAAHLIYYAGSNRDIAPQMIVNTSSDLTRSDIVDVDAGASDVSEGSMDTDGDCGSSSDSYI